MPVMFPAPEPDRLRRPGPFARFRSAKGGNVAIIFALASLPLLAFTGAAIDYGWATRLQVKLQAATDATALGLCQTPLTTTAAQLQLQAANVATGYMGTAGNLIVDTLAVTSNPRQISLTTHITARTFFPAFTHVTSPQVMATSRCATPLPKTFEIALVLDNTGSMAESGGSQTKIQAVQTAASNFVDYVQNNGAFASDSRISIVPFAAAVAVDPTAYAAASWVDTGGKSVYHWTNVDKDSAKSFGYLSRLSIFGALKNVKSSWGWAGCFETSPYPQNVQDGAPSTANTQAGWNTLYVPLFAPDEPGDASSSGAAAWYPYNNNRQTASYSFNSYLDDGLSSNSSSCPSSQSTFAAAEMQACKYYYAKSLNPASNSSTGIPTGPNFQCVSKPLQRLTSNSTTLKTLINSMTAAGSTNIHEGMMWGWRTLSPVSVFGDGDLYSSTTTNKVLILMTDGANSWADNPYNNYNQTLYFSQGYLTNGNGTDPTPRMPPAYQTTQSISSTSQQRNALDQLTLETCTNAKAAGISIYTIGFSVSSDPIDSQGIQLLQKCATKTSQAFIANDSNGLITAFSQIAASIGALRISQ